MKMYNVIGFYPECNEWCLICLGNNDKEHMEKVIEEIKQNPKLYGVDLARVTDFKLDEVENTPDKWWNWKLD